MCIAATFINDEVSTLSGYAIFADARLGGNGDPWGTPERVVGQDEYNAEYDRLTWDSNLEDGFDTGQVSSSLVVTSDVANDTVFADNQITSDSLSYSSTSIGHIGIIEFRAFTQAAGAVQWSDVDVRFYRDDVLIESYSASAGPSVDTSTSTEDTTSEAILRITPGATDYDRVEIYGVFRMTFDSPNVYAGPTDMAAQIFVYSAVES
jgi:hypothetical protein